MKFPIPIEVAKRFVAKVEVGDSCWNWVGGKDKDGYGDLRSSSITRKAHKISYLIFVGAIPVQLFVLHKCDNPGCVNPDHLFLGTQKDNMRDMDSKGRRKIQSGENAWNSKLTYRDVSRIKSLRRDGVAIRKIAARLSLPYWATHSVCLGRTWRTMT